MTTRLPPSAPRTPGLLLSLSLGLALAAGCGRSSLYGADGGQIIPCEGAGCPPTDGPPFGIDTDLPPFPTDGPPFPTDGPPFPTDGPPFPTDGPPFPTDGPPQPGDLGCGQLPEVCNNGVDDNCDNLVDCMDPECKGDPACPAPGIELCNNGIDDDKNGLVDCADPACAAFPGCQPHMCDKNNPDCKDPACVNEPACQNLVCKPTVDFGAIARNDAKSERKISTVGTVDVAKQGCVNAGGGQVVTQFDVVSDATAVLMTFVQDGNADHAFGLYRSGVNQACTANPVECFVPKVVQPTGSHTFVVDKGRYYLLVMAVTKQHQGTIDVTLSTASSMKKEVCNNGVDDDGNGLIDCADPSCFNDLACAKSECKPDVNVGTVVPGGPKSAQVDSTGGNADLKLGCGGSGKARVIQFTLAEAVVLGTTVQQQGGGDHAMALYRMPPAGKACNADLVQCQYLMQSPFFNWVWDEVVGAGTYVLILQAVKPGAEGPLDVTLTATRIKKVELCHNGIDDDLNELVDCADAACFADPNCPAPICSPDDDFGTLRVGGQGKTANLDLVNGVPHLVVPCAQGSGRSRVVQFTLEQPAGIAMSCNQLGGSAVLELVTEAAPRASCDEHAAAGLCGDPSVIPFGCNWVWPSQQPGTYYIIVQAFQAGDEGKVDLTLSAVPDKALEICNNGVDDDLDGFTDCADKKCVLSPLCQKKACKADATIDPMPVNGMMVIENLDTGNAPSLVSPSCAAAPGTPTQVVLLNLPQKATLTVNYSQPFGAFDHVLALYPVLGQGLVCDAAQAISCQPTLGMPLGTLTFANLAAGQYWLVAAANKADKAGIIDLQLSAKP